MAGTSSRRAVCRRLRRSSRTCRAASTRPRSAPMSTRTSTRAPRHESCAQRCRRRARAASSPLSPCRRPLRPPTLLSNPSLTRLSLGPQHRVHDVHPEAPKQLVRAAVQLLLRGRQGVPFGAHPATHQGEARREHAARARAPVGEPQAARALPVTRVQVPGPLLRQAAVAP